MGGQKASGREQHEHWLEKHQMSTAHVGPMNEVTYTGVLVGTLIGAPTAAKVVLDAMLDGHPIADLSNKITRVEVPSKGPDIAVALSIDGSERLVIIEHKRFGPSNAPALSTLKRPVKDFPYSGMGVLAQKRRKEDPDRPGVWQLDAVTCFDDWRPPNLDEIPIGACVLLDAQDRDINDAYGPLAYPDQWQAVGYTQFGARIRAAYDMGDSVVRTGITSALLGLYAYSSEVLSTVAATDGPLTAAEVNGVLGISEGPGTASAG